MDFLNSLSFAQWIFIIIGAIIAGSGAFPYVKDWLASLADSSEPNVQNVDPHCCDYLDRDLTSIVCKWECLADACEYMGLDAATEKLNEVFPLLIEVRADEEKEEEEF